MKKLGFMTVFLLVASLLMATGASAQVDTGSADFSRFVALGDSLSAGFTSGGLGGPVQANSFPALIARQAGAADFQQPTISLPGIPAFLQLVSLQGPVILPASATPGAPTNLTLPRPYNNLAVPGFEVHDVLATLTGNALIDIILRGQGTALQQALAQQPTFVLLWIGSNDALAAATSGVVIDDVTLTSLNKFEADYRTIAGAIAQSGAKMVTATVVNVTAIPFVNTIPPVVVDPATRQPVIVGGQPVPLLGPQGPLSPADKVLLTASSLLVQGIGIPAALGGTGQPLPDQVVLSASEVATIQDRIDGYNAVIRTVAGETGAAVFDAAGFFDQVAQQGFAVGGIDFTTDFLTGGLFSYDGVHPSAIGYAITANRIIDAINSTFGAAIPPVDLSKAIFGQVSQGTAPPPASPVVFTPQAGRSLLTALRVIGRQDLERRVSPQKGVDLAPIGRLEVRTHGGRP